MRRLIGRRATFFFILVVICLIMVPVTPSEFRWVAWGSAGLAAFWAVLLSVEHVSKRRESSPPGPDESTEA